MDIKLYHRHVIELNGRHVMKAGNWALQMQQRPRFKFETALLGKLGEMAFEEACLNQKKNWATDIRCLIGESDGGVDVILNGKVGVQVKTCSDAGPYIKDNKLPNANRLMATVGILSKNSDNNEEGFNIELKEPANKRLNECGYDNIYLQIKPVDFYVLISPIGEIKLTESNFEGADPDQLNPITLELVGWASAQDQGKDNRCSVRLNLGCDGLWQRITEVLEVLAQKKDKLKTAPRSANPCRDPLKIRGELSKQPVPVL